MGTDDGAVVWQGPPDPERGVYYPICAARNGHELIGVVLSETVVGVLTYYEFGQWGGDRGRTRPCLGSLEKCKGCRLKLEHRWKGYVGCWDRNKGRLFLAEITREAYLRCPAFELFKGQLRGKMLRLTRNGEAKNSRVTATVKEYAGPIESLPTAFNVQSALERVWFGVKGPGRELEGPGDGQPAAE